MDIEKQNIGDKKSSMASCVVNIGGTSVTVANMIKNQDYPPKNYITKGKFARIENIVTYFKNSDISKDKILRYSSDVKDHNLAYADTAELTDAYQSFLEIVSACSRPDMLAYIAKKAPTKANGKLYIKRVQHVCAFFYTSYLRCFYEIKATNIAEDRIEIRLVETPLIDYTYSNPDCADLHKIDLDEPNRTDALLAFIQGKPANAKARPVRSSSLDIKKNVLVNFIGKEAVVDIPDGVTEIGERAFYCKDTIQSVTIPNTVVRIGEYAFFGCNNLKKLFIPDSVTEISGSAISGETLLSASPRNVCAAQYAMKYRSRIEIVYTDVDNQDPYIISDSVLIRYCGSGNKVVVPDFISKIGKGAFYGHTAVQEIILHENIREIDEQAFCYCTNLERINLPDQVSEIGKRAFMYCSSLEKVVLPAGIDSIKELTFTYCDHLKSITIQNGVTYIGSSSFDGCGKLSGIVLPESITSIHGGAFADCVELDEIEIPAQVVDINEQAFLGCVNLERVVLNEGLQKMYAKVFKGCTMLERIAIPSTVIFIGKEVFRGCGHLKVINIPSIVCKFGIDTFAECPELTIQTYSNSPAAKYAQSNGIALDIRD